MVAASTPAVSRLIEEKVAHRVHFYDHDPRLHSYGAEAAAALTRSLGVAAEQVLKTLVVKRADSTLAVVVLPVTMSLSLRTAATVLSTRKIVMAERTEVERSTGYIFGGISPLGQKRPLPTVIEESALAWDLVLCSGGRRGMEIEIDPRELVRLTGAMAAPVAAQ